MPPAAHSSTAIQSNGPGDAISSIARTTSPSTTISASQRSRCNIMRPSYHQVKTSSKCQMPPATRQTRVKKAQSIPQMRTSCFSLFPFWEILSVRISFCAALRSASHTDLPGPSVILTQLRRSVCTAKHLRGAAQTALCPAPPPPLYLGGCYRPPDPPLGGSPHFTAEAQAGPASACKVAGGDRRPLRPALAAVGTWGRTGLTPCAPARPWACAPAVCLRRPPGFRAVAFLSLGRCLVFSSVCFGGSRELPSSFGSFVGGVVGRVLAAAPRASFSVGCAAGGDALALQSLAVRGAASRVSVFCAGDASGAGFWRFSAFSVVQSVVAAGASPVWLAGGPLSAPLGERLAARSRGRSSLAASRCRSRAGFCSRPCRVARSLRPGRLRLPASRSSSSVAGGILLCSLRCWRVVRGRRCSVARSSAGSFGSRPALCCPRGPRSAVRRVAGCRGVRSRRLAVRLVLARRCSRAVRSARSASAAELPAVLGPRGVGRAAPFFAVSEATSSRNLRQDTVKKPITPATHLRSYSLIISRAMQSNKGRHHYNGTKRTTWST